MLKTTLLSTVLVPELCPVCLGSGLIIGGGPPFVPLWMSNRTGYSVKCGRCDGKGWLSDKTEPTSTEVELQIVQEILVKNSAGLNIDDVTRFSGLDIPTVYRALHSLRDKGMVGVKSGSPIVYYAINSDVQ
jgi:hypothetical protein